MITTVKIVCPRREAWVTSEYDEDPTHRTSFATLVVSGGTVVVSSNRSTAYRLSLLEIQSLVQVLKGHPVTINPEPINTTDIIQGGHLFEAVTYSLKEEGENRS